MATNEGSLSPATGTEEKLKKLSASTGAILDSFDEILKLPYVDALRVDATGTMSVHDVVLALRSKYYDLQMKSLPFARDIYSYSELQISTIPMINKGSLTLKNYILMNKSIIVRKKASASTLKEESQAFRKEFSGQIDILQGALVELDKQIGELEKSIQETTDKYEAAMASAIISGILVGVFAAAFVFAMVASAGAIASVAGPVSGAAATFGASLQAAGGMSGLVGGTIASGTGLVASLTTTIVKSIEAGNLASAINALKALKSSAETVYDQLKVVIGKMETLEAKLEDIVGVWQSVDDSLSIILKDITSWEAGLFNEQVAELTVQEWKNVKAAVEKYTNVVSGDRAIKTVEAHEEKPQLTAEQLMRGLGTFSVDELKKCLCAPEVQFSGRLADMASSGTTLSTLLREFGNDPKIVQQAKEASSALDEARKRMRRSSAKLDSTAEDSQSMLAKVLTENSGTVDAMTLRYALEERLGRLSSEHDAITNEATKAEQSAFAFQRSVGIVVNTLQRRVGEKQQEVMHSQKRLKEIEAEKRRRMWLSFIPVAGIINELVDLANNTQGKIRRLRREIHSLQRTRSSLVAASNSVQVSVKDSTLICQTFSSILNDNSAISASLLVIESLKLDTPRAIFVDAKNSWSELEDDIESFLR